MQNLNKVPSNTSETKTYRLFLAALLTRDEQSMKKRNINIIIIIIIIIIIYVLTPLRTGRTGWHHSKIKRPIFGNINLLYRQFYC